MSETEVWKRIWVDGESTNYEVSNLGKLRNYTNKRLRKLSKNGNGYLATHIIVKGRERTFDIHILVARTFIEKTEEDIAIGRDQVNHKDGNKENNCVDNLEWVTRSENVNHAYYVLHSYKIEKGEKCIAAKYTEKQIRKVCEYLTRTSYTHSEIAKLAGVTIYVVDDVARGRTWTHISKEYGIVDRVRSWGNRLAAAELYMGGKYKQFSPIIDEGFIHGYTKKQIYHILDDEFDFNYKMSKKLKKLIKSRHKELKRKYPDGIASYVILEAV